MASRTEKDRNSGRIEFISAHVPAIPAGDYAVTVAQELNITAPTPVRQRYVGKAQKIRVKPPAGRINPTQVRSVYPPEGSLGDHGFVLPHIILTPSTLPWERSGVAPASVAVPWLALLLFSEAEYRQVTLPEPADGGDGGDGPAPARIQVPAGLLRRLLPTREELKYLCHVRQAVDATGKIQGEEVAVIMGNRLPGGGGNIAHLVSIEGKFAGATFPAEAVEDNEQIQLVSLKSWRFASVDPSHGFTGLLRNLQQRTFRLDDVSLPAANVYLRRGNTLLPHRMRQGNQSASWYRGPLIPGHHDPEDEVALPVRSADELVRFNEALGVFDVSYAVAWELGRLLMLNSKGVAMNLYHWKQANARKIKAAEAEIDHLPFDGPAADLGLPRGVVGWLERTALLEGVPFHNLVADERLLPTEAIRFFEVDWRWIECLLDGAFSIGRVLTPDHQRDRALHAAHVDRPHRVMSGFLVRSAAVAGWPDLRVEAYDTERPNLAPETEELFQVGWNALHTLRSRSVTEEDQIAQIRQVFGEEGIALSGQLTLDQRAWFITDDGIPRSELSKTFNDEIDVRTRDEEGGFRFAGRIDAVFETDLRQSRRSKDLERAFTRIDLELPEELYVSGSRWFLSDKGRTHYLIERDDDHFRVYRDYRLPLLRFERLSKNVLIAIFEGRIRAVDFHLEPEAIHHGVHAAAGGGFAKFLRDENGRPQPDREIEVTMWDATTRIVDVADLASKLTESNEPSEFALQLVEGVPKVRFVVE